jgi:peptidoglycan/LPS O-acetylase OafA/YrhL
MDDVATVTPTLTADPPATPRGGARFPCFDGLRALAAISVVVYHTVTHYNVLSSEYATWEWINRLGNFGVSAFFLMSGFLLYRPFVVAHFRDGTAPNPLSFWRRRFFRIFPAYWVVLTAAVILGFASISGISSFFTGYALLQNYRFGYELYGLGVEWTLVIEVSFYLALPLLALALRRASPADASLERKLRGQLVGLAAMYLIAMSVRIWSLWFLNDVAHYKGDWFPLSQASTWLVGYLDWFAAGMLLAVGSAWVASGRRLPWVGRLLAAHPWASWLIALECYWVALKLNLPVSVFDKVTRIQSFGIAFVYGLVAFFLLFPAVFGPQDRGRIRRFLQHPVMVWLGTVSYGIYLWHMIYVKEAERWTRNGWLGTNVFLWLAVVLPLTVLTAATSYYLIERPIINRSHGRPSRPRARTPVAGANASSDIG